MGELFTAPQLGVGPAVDAGPDPVGEGGEGLLAGDGAPALPGCVAPADVNLDRTGADPDAELGGLIWEVAKDTEESGPEGAEKSR